MRLAAFFLPIAPAWALVERGDDLGDQEDTAAGRQHAFAASGLSAGTKYCRISCGVVRAAGPFAVERSQARPGGTGGSRRALPALYAAFMRLRLLAFLLIGVMGAMGQSGPDHKEWIQLFNGKNLDGWVPKITGYAVGENALNTFRVENGLLTVRYDQYERFDNRFGHLFHKEPYSYYVIAVEYRFTGGQAPGGPAWAARNSGIMVHGQPAETMQRDQDFPISIEVQLLGGLGKGPRPTANLCTPGTHVEMDGALFTAHCVSSKSPTLDGDQWVRVEAHVHGGEWIRHVVNGEAVLEYQKPQIGGGNVGNHDPAVKRDGEILTGGSISLQSESHPIEFRKVELLNLSGCRDAKAKNYKRYVVRDAPGACQY